MYYMLIADPFNKTYTAAKVPFEADEASLYKDAFKKAYERLVVGECFC